jgi:hypothetical protein
MTDALDRKLGALRREVSTLNPPPTVDRAVAAAIGRAERRALAPVRSSWPAEREYWLAGALAAAALLLLLVWTLRVPPDELQGERTAASMPAAATDFIPVVPVEDIVRTQAAYIVSTPMPRTMLADFGLPVSPTRAAEPVASELLVRGDGTVLAIRFLE